jgi:hypothetical protein
MRRLFLGVATCCFVVSLFCWAGAVWVNTYLATPAAAFDFMALIAFVVAIVMPFFVDEDDW